jgi:Cof subfamily protein (haloacid dehalogenase superfamily)
MLGVVPSIDLIALDLDGTLLGPTDEISSADRAALEEAIRAGIHVVLVTGRGVETPELLAQDLGLGLPIICCHGALTKDIASGRVIGHIPLPLDIAKTMLSYAEQHRFDAAVYLGERFYRLEGMRAYMADMVAPQWQEVASFATLMTAPPTFIRFLGREAARTVRERFAQARVHFKYETWGEFEELAVTNLRATKKNALERLCRNLAVTPERVLAIGDSRNDVPMLRWAGIGVAMGNALPEVKAAVKHVTDRNDQNGVARAIERYALEPLDRERRSA